MAQNVAFLSDLALCHAVYADASRPDITEPVVVSALAATFEHFRCHVPEQRRSSS